MKGFTVAKSKWRYFSLRVPKTVAVSVAIKETQTQGMLWLFLNSRQTPTLIVNEGADRSITSAYHQIALVKESFFKGLLSLVEMFFLTNFFLFQQMKSS
jgi:hypothetical protein